MVIIVFIVHSVPGFMQQMSSSLLVFHFHHCSLLMQTSCMLSSLPCFHTFYRSIPTCYYHVFASDPVDTIWNVPLGAKYMALPSSNPYPCLWLLDCLLLELWLANLSPLCGRWLIGVSFQHNYTYVSVLARRCGPKGTFAGWHSQPYAYQKVL